jgi:hypothetical protein
MFGEMAAGPRNRSPFDSVQDMAKKKQNEPPRRGKVLNFVAASESILNDLIEAGTTEFVGDTFSG